MKVLIADGQASVRHALKILLEQEDEPFLLAEAPDLKSLAEKIEGFKPDITMLDCELAGQAAGDVIPRLKRLAPGMMIIAMSVRPEAAGAALEAGADAFVSKGENSDRLLEIVRNYAHEAGMKTACWPDAG